MFLSSEEKDLEEDPKPGSNYGISIKRGRATLHWRVGWTGIPTT